jgi:GntR family transcriptional regulator
VEPRQGSGTFVCQAAPLPQADVPGLRDDLAAWVARARAAGLDRSDIQALVTDVVTDQEDPHDD